MVQDFQRRFLAGKAQREPLMDQFAKFLNRAWDHFPSTSANLIVSSALEFVTSLIIDADHPSMEVRHIHLVPNTNLTIALHQVHASAVNFPRWMRTMNGASPAFAFFIFPSNIPLEVSREEALSHNSMFIANKAYIQIISDTVNIVDDVK